MKIKPEINNTFLFNYVACHVITVIKIISFLRPLANQANVDTDADPIDTSLDFEMHKSIHLDMKRMILSF